MLLVSIKSLLATLNYCKWALKLGVSTWPGWENRWPKPKPIWSTNASSINDRRAICTYDTTA